MRSTRVAHLPFLPTVTYFFPLPSTYLPPPSSGFLHDQRPVTLAFDDHELGREPESEPARRAHRAPFQVLHSRRRRRLPRM